MVTLSKLFSLRLRTPKNLKLGIYFSGLATALLILPALCAFSIQTQESPSNSTRPILTLFEIESLKHLPVGVTNICINVWGDGRLHMERRIQIFPSPTADMMILDGALPDAQLQELQHILNTDEILRLPAISLSNLR